MCETFVTTTGEEITNHEHADYTCPKCGEEWCWSCNPSDRRGSWHGESACAACGETLVEAKA